MNDEPALTGNNYPIIAAVKGDVESVLDVGFGLGTLGAMVRDFRKPKRIVGIEVWKPYLAYASLNRRYDETYEIDLEKNASLPFHESEFDCALCIEVLEHLSWAAGLRLIAEMKRVARCVILTTPNGFHRQTALDGNPHQKHLSGWSVKELKRLDFKVRGIGCFAPFGIQIRKPLDLSYLLTSMTWVFPNASLGLMATWQKHS